LKWRPKNFDEIIGQNHIVGTLKSAIDKKRLAHAYLFAGPRGVGKTSTARILAKALNCKNGPTTAPCGTCPSCIEISQGRSLDVLEIDGASNRGIDEIRTLRENVKFAPVQGKFKVYIIDEVHQITPDGFNALLKTLEEPPEFVKFIFATTQPHKVIPTILSRCQRFDFRRIAVMEIIAQLEKIVAAEKIDIDKEVLFAIARASDGSLRDAESVLDQLVSFSKGKVSLKDVVSVLGLVEEEALFEMADKIIKKDAKSALALLNTIIEEGKDTGVFFNSIIEHFRNLMIAKVAQADSKLIDLPQEICQKLAEQAKDFTLEEIFSAFSVLVNAQEMSKRLDSLRIPLEISLVKLAHDKRSPGAQANPAPKPTSGASIAPAPLKNNPPAVNPAKEKPQTPTSFEDLKGAWNNIIESLGRIKMSAATYLNEGSPLKLENNILTVSFPRNYSLHKESLERKENKAIIEKTVSEIFNTDLRVNFILSQERVEREDAQEHPFVKSALDMFKGRIIREG
ncbi:MAG: DNA polymerase III subunit gamma/tau, partial [Candidatus Omnitrophica bacterium]|nr:DNA polymerase III subunit gamma/tau [Candidatus Omnitrophota bacterium]